MRHTNDECLICKAPLEYLEKPEPMRCEICFKTFDSTARCVKGHFVCDDCHSGGGAPIHRRPKGQTQRRRRRRITVQSL
mgnify:CR=1 FL=1